MHPPDAKICFQINIIRNCKYNFTEENIQFKLFTFYKRRVLFSSPFPFPAGESFVCPLCKYDPVSYFPLGNGYLYVTNFYCTLLPSFIRNSITINVISFISVTGIFSNQGKNHNTQLNGFFSLIAAFSLKFFQFAGPDEKLIAAV